MGAAMGQSRAVTPSTQTGFDTSSARTCPSAFFLPSVWTCTTLNKLRAVRSVGDAEGWVWFFQKESELCVPPFEHVNVGHLIRELDGHDQIAIVIRLYYY